MDENEKELMNSLRDIMNNAQKGIVSDSQTEMDEMSRNLADAFMSEIENDVKTAVFGVTILDGEEEQEARNSWQEGSTHTLKSSFVESVQDKSAKCARVADIIHGLDKNDLLRFFEDFDGMMLLSGWLNPAGLIAFVRNDDGSVFQVFTTKEYVNTTRTLPTGDKVTRNYRVGENAPDQSELSEYELDLVRSIHVGLAMPMMVKHESEDLYDVMMTAIQAKVERVTRYNQED